MPLGDQFFLQGNVVLYDAVVHYYELTGAIHVGMRVRLGGSAVGRPAGMANADIASEIFPPQGVFQILDLPDTPVDLARPLLEAGDAGGIVAPVPESFH